MLVVGANLALDRTLRMSRLIPGQVQRPRSAEVTAGGKAVNVSRACRAHDLRPRLIANLPGTIGNYLGDLLEAEGHDVRRVATSGEARSAIVILEDQGRATVLNEPGPEMTSQDRAHLLGAIEQELPGRQVLACLGSLPPGDSEGLYTRIVELGRRAAVPVVLDAARQDLFAALPARPHLVTPNLAEALAVLNGGEDEPVEAGGDDVRACALQAAEGLCAAGALNAVVTAGRHGAAGAGEGGSFWIAAPQVQEVNPIGAGDSFVAGLCAGLRRGFRIADAAVLGVATASASVTLPLAGDVPAELARRLCAELTWQAV
ncbi:MAG: 1-phosphofructokinase [Actinomycetota bacterium]|nr:1-phosphofructokinase [Actinomycetota bacterium]